MRWMLAATLYGVAALAHGQEGDRLETLRVTVTAEAPEQDLPLAVSTVEAGTLPAASERSLQDLLEPAPGLFAQNQDNAAQGLRVAIRGFGARAAFGVRGIRVYMDGVPMTLPDGQTELDALDLALLDSAQVIRGPSAALFGNAAGGAILLQSRRPGDKPELRLDWQEASFDNRRLRLEGSGRAQDFGLLGSYLDTDSDGFREHAATESELLNARLEHALGNGELSISVSDLAISAEDPGGLNATQVRDNRKAAAPNNLTFNAGESIGQQRLALHWEGSLRDWSVQLTGYGGQRDFDNRLPFTDGGQVEFDRGFGGLGLTLNRRMDRHRFSAGMDAQTQTDDRQRFDNNNGQRGARTLDQEERARALGLFVRDTIALSNHWETSLGLRYDHIKLSADDDFLADGDDSGDRKLHDWSADISLAHWIDSAMLYARIASSFETPTINELANPAGGGFNPDLDSTRAINYEIGAKGSWQSLRYTAALYRIDVDDELQPFELASQPGRTFFRNAGQTRRLGLELTAEQPLGEAWKLRASYTRADQEFDSGSLSGNQLPGLPEQTGWLALHYQRQALRAAVIGQYVGRLYADDSNDTLVDSYALLNLQGSWAFSPRLLLALGIDNLLDKDYNDNIRINAFGGRYFEPAAGRNYRLRLSLRF